MSARALAAALLFALALLVFAGAQPARADTFTQIIRALRTGDAYVSPAVIRDGHARVGDDGRLESVARTNANKGVLEKFLIVRSYPRNQYASPAAAAAGVRDTLNFPGTLIMVSEGGMGIATSDLSAGERTNILRQVESTCIAQSYADCAIMAGNDVVTRIQSDKSNNSRNAAVFWVVALVILAAVIFALVWLVRRRQSAVTGRLGELRRAASNTLSLADDAVGEIEGASTGAGNRLPAEVQAEYDRALALRDQARAEVERGSSEAALTQANQEAAQAVLALQGVMRKMGISTPLANPLEDPGRRCFYCGRDDRPPYTRETISDNGGNSMEVWVCSVDQARLQQGQRPEIATANYAGSTVPWWATPGNPWYYSYGGPSWQNWLPFFAGLELGHWFGGGYGYGWGGPVMVEDGMDRDDYGYGGGDAGMAAQAPQDASGVDFGSGGWDSGGGGWDSGGGGADSGGGGWDSGGGDWGGGDSGGGDWS